MTSTRMEQTGPNFLIGFQITLFFFFLVFFVKSVYRATFYFLSFFYYLFLFVMNLDQFVFNCVMISLHLLE